MLPIPLTVWCQICMLPYLILSLRNECLKNQITMQTENEVKEWFPHHIISGEEALAVLVLNQPLSGENIEYLKSIWNTALFRVAVDGGANQLKEISNAQTELIPDLICGDFDSAMPDVLEYYKKKDVEIVHTPDQDETDFTKALRLTANKTIERKLEISSIVALSRNIERLDHILGNLNTLFLSHQITSVPVIILGQSSLTWLLWPGNHVIHINEKMMDSHVGLIPLGQECNSVSTTGLKWNLTKDKMKFGGLISTCNLFEKNIVTVSTDTPLVWTMEVIMR